jgi:hypothetical protein
MKAISALLDETNIGGLQHTLLILPVVAVAKFPLASITDYYKYPVNDIEISSELYPKWLKLFTTIDNGILQEEEKFTDHGPLYEYRLECFVPKIYNARPMQFNELAQMQYLVVCLDQNDFPRIIGLSEAGQKNRGCDLSWKYSTGKVGKDRNGYLFTFTFETGNKAPIAKGIESLAIQTGTYNL